MGSCWPSVSGAAAPWQLQALCTAEQREPSPSEARDRRAGAAIGPRIERQAAGSRIGASWDADGSRGNDAVPERPFSLLSSRLHGRQCSHLIHTARSPSLPPLIHTARCSTLSTSLPASSPPRLLRTAALRHIVNRLAIPNSVVVHKQMLRQQLAPPDQLVRPDPPTRRRLRFDAQLSLQQGVQVTDGMVLGSRGTEAAEGESREGGLTGEGVKAERAPGWWQPCGGGCPRPSLSDPPPLRRPPKRRMRGGVLGYRLGTGRTLTRQVLGTTI
jgi:hypothetical protein